MSGENHPDFLGRGCVPGDDRPKHYSSVYVVAPPNGIERTVARLEALEGVEAHHVDAPTGRIVVVHEAGTVDELNDGLHRIRALPEVVLAEPVYYFVDSVPESEAPRSAGSNRPLEE